MTASIVCAMTDQGRLDRALELVLEADSTLHAAIQSAGERGLELFDVAAYVGTASDFLLAAGAFPAMATNGQGPLPVAEAAARADGLLRDAAQQFPRGSELSDEEFEALMELWGAIRGLWGWV